jgi:hypothetical protein
MVTLSRELVELILRSIKEVPEIGITNYGTKSSSKLRKLVSCASGMLQKLPVLNVGCPHHAEVNFPTVIR